MLRSERLSLGLFANWKMHWRMGIDVKAFMLQDSDSDSSPRILWQARMQHQMDHFLDTQIAYI